MTQMNLEDVEKYIMKRAGDIYEMMGPGRLRAWLQTSFAELRAREESKERAEAREAREADAKLVADIQAEEAIRGP